MVDEIQKFVLDLSLRYGDLIEQYFLEVVVMVVLFFSGGEGNDDEVLSKFGLAEYFSQG